MLDRGIAGHRVHSPEGRRRARCKLFKGGQHVRPSDERPTILDQLLLRLFRQISPCSDQLFANLRCSRAIKQIRRLCQRLHRQGASAARFLRESPYGCRDRRLHQLTFMRLPLAPILLRNFRMRGIIRRRVPRGIGVDLQLGERVQEILRDRVVGIVDFTLHGRSRFRTVRRAEKPEHQIPSSGLVVQTPEHLCECFRRCLRVQKPQFTGCFSLLVVSRVLVSRGGVQQLLVAPIGIHFDYFELNRVRAQGQRDAAVGSRFARVRWTPHPIAHNVQPIVSGRRLSPLIQLGSRGEWFVGKLLRVA